MGSEGHAGDLHAGAGALRFAPTVAAAAKPGETVVPLLELASAADRRVDAIVAVHRSAPASEVVVEVWTFDQANDDGVLARVGAPQPLLRGATSGTSAPALQPLRLRMAAPGATMQRLLGTPADTPQAALEALAAAARLVRDPATAPGTRVESLARVFAGLDDGMLFERDALGLALDRLADDRWRIEVTSSGSDRRASARTVGGDTLELLRKGDGWVIAAVDSP